ncbi:MAG: hypothetical protein Kow0079_03170 [Vicingaceae bacterium]
MELVQDKNSRAGMIGTILFHAVLLLLFLIFGLSYPDPPPPEEGITINFGTSDQGSGEVQTEETSKNEATEESNSSPSNESSSNEVLTQDVEETPAINSSESNTNNESENNTENQPTVSNELNNVLNNAWNNSSAASEGQTNNEGNQGDINGDPNSNNYTGGGVGNGVTYSLSGRNLLSTPKINDNSQEEGKVVVDITVDKNGKVVKAIPGARGSTTTSPILYKKAKEAALKAKFNAKPNAPEEQKGQMTFIFILN